MIIFCFHTLQYKNKYINFLDTESLDEKALLNTAISVSILTLPLISHADSPYFSLKDGDGFKRFSVSVGALHVMPQGKVRHNPLILIPLLLKERNLLLEVLQLSQY